jgi:uncharacterized protein (TIGR03086 family)
MTEARVAERTQPDEVVQLDARAVRASVSVVARVSDADLGRATPCAGWSLADLLAHMTVEHHRFAAAAGAVAAGAGAVSDAGVVSGSVSGGGVDPAVSGRFSLDSAATMVSAYRSAANRVIDAFRADGVLDREFALPQITTATTFPARQAIGFHFVDYVVHGWDVAASLGLGYDLDPDLIDAALVIARAVPDDEGRRRPGAAFAPGLPATAPGLAATAPGLAEILALLGRSPSWPAVP